MVNLFSKKTAANIILLFIIVLAIKIPLFFNIPPLHINENDGLLSVWIKKYIDTSNISVQYISLIIACFLIFIQALRLNYIANNQRLYVYTHYLPALGYIIILNLLPNAQSLSVPLLLNIGLINILSSLFKLYNHIHPKTLIYNIGLLLGIMMLLYTPSYLYAIVLFLTLFIMRPFQIAEWLIALLGIITPYYFWYTYLFLTDQWDFWRWLPHISLHNPLSTLNTYNSISILSLVTLLIIGFIYLQKNNVHMVIQVRKNWTIIILMLFVSLVIPFIQAQTNFTTFILGLPMCTLIIANAAVYPSKKIISSILYWLLLLYGVFLYYVH